MMSKQNLSFNSKNKKYSKKSRMLISVFILFYFIEICIQIQIQRSDESLFYILAPLSLPFSSNNFPSSFGEMKPAGPISWTDCGGSDDLFQLESLELIPDPPRRSAPLTVKLRGYLLERLNEGVIRYEVKFGGFKLANGKLDGCDALKKERNLPQCPIGAGPIDVTHTIELPWQIPSGKYLVNVNGARSDDQKQIFCLNLDISIN